MRDWSSERLSYLPLANMQQLSVDSRIRISFDIFTTVSAATFKEIPDVIHQWEAS